MEEGRSALVALSRSAEAREVRAEVEIHGLSSHGAGVGRLADGRTVFVPRAAPQERVRVRLSREKPRWAQGVLEEVLEASPSRRAPLCRLYEVCGGCQLQHLPEDVQRLWKARNVVEALGRIGGIAGVETPEVVPSPRSVGYRNRMSFTLVRLPSGRVLAGLHALDRPGRIVEVRDECLLPREEITASWTALRDAWGQGAGLLPEGERLRLTLRVARDRRVALLVQGGRDGWSPEDVLSAVPSITTVVHRPDPRFGTERRAVALEDEDAGVGFEQVNEEAAEALEAHVVEVASGAARVVDAYCGSGRYGRVLAARGSRVVGIELDPDAAADGMRGAPPGFAILVGPAETLLPEVLPADLLIVNPPRTGLDPAVTEVVLERVPDRLVYVSCDPATLSRDLARLLTRYDLGAVRCFDLFPQTAHVETVVTMNLRGGS